jgi:hypothetical protein
MFTTHPQIRRIAAAIAAGTLVLVPAVDAATGKRPQKAGATYDGITSQGDSNCRSNNANDQPCAVTLKVSGNARRVAKMQIYFFAECDDEQSRVFRSSTLFENPRIRKGKFAVTTSYNEKLGDGSKAKNAVTLHGKFTHVGSKYKVAGDYSIKAHITLTDGTSTDCTSGKVTYKAKV